MVAFLHKSPALFAGVGLFGVTILLGLCLCSPPFNYLQAQQVCNYFVDNQHPNASDSYSPAQNDESHPWLTIQRAADLLSAGDTACIKDGRYRESVRFTRSGTLDQPIVFCAFEGHHPVVHYSARLASEWTACSAGCPSGTYEAVLAESTSVGHVIYTNMQTGAENILNPVDNLNLLVENSYCQSGATLYLRLANGVNPADQEIGILKYWPGGSEWNDVYSEAPGVFVFDSSHIEVAGLAIKYGLYYGVFIRGDYNTVRDCEIKYQRANGVNIGEKRPAGEADQLVSPVHPAYGGNEVVDYLFGAKVIGSVIMNSSMKNYPRGSRAIDWGGGLAIWSANDSVISNNRIFNNHGEGIILMGHRDSIFSGMRGPQNITITGNTVYDNWSQNILLDYTGNSLIDGNFVYVSGLQPPVPDGDMTALKRNNPTGITLAEEYDFGQPNDLIANRLTNNIVLNCRPGIKYWWDTNAYSYYQSTPGLKETLIANNTVVNTVSDALDYRIALYLDEGAHTATTLSNNLILQTAGGTGYYLFYFHPSGAASKSEGFAFDHQLWYHQSMAAPFNWKNTQYDFPGWMDLPKSDGASVDNQSLYDRPELVNPGGFLAEDYQFFPEFSPARNAGAPLTAVAADFWQTARPQETGYDIGAYEFTTGGPSFDLDHDGDIDPQDFVMLISHWKEEDFFEGDYLADSEINAADGSALLGQLAGYLPTPTLLPPAETPTAVLSPAPSASPTPASTPAAVRWYSTLDSDLAITSPEIGSAGTPTGLSYSDGYIDQSQAAVFDQATDHISLPMAGQLSNQAGRISFWYRHIGEPLGNADSVRFFGTDQGNYYFDFNRGSSDTMLSAQLGAGSSASWAGLETNVFDGSWHQLQISWLWDAGENDYRLNLYLDGSAQEERLAGDQFSDTANLLIGNRATFDRNLAGQLDEFKIY